MLLYHSLFAFVVDGRSPILNDRGSFESICEGLKAHGFILQVIDCLSLSGVQSAEAVSSETPQTEAMKSLHEMADTVADGSVFAIDDALEAMVFVEKRTRQTVYYRGALDIAGKVKIPVEAYMRTNSQKYPSFFKVPLTLYCFSSTVRIRPCSCSGVVLCALRGRRQCRER